MCTLAKGPNKTNFVEHRVVANENILNFVNDPGLSYICRLRLDVTVSDKIRKAKRLIRDVA